MSSTRNKRKRTETDPRSGGRPKSREQRDAAAGNGKKNEVPTKPAVTTNASKTNTNPGNSNVEIHSSTVATRKHKEIAQHASASASVVKERDAATNTGDSSVPIPSKSKSNNNSSNNSNRHKGSLSPNVTSATTKPLHSRQIASSCDPSEDGLPHDRNRYARLQGLITHRSSLRRRILYCAAAASERLGEEIGESSYSKLELSEKKARDKDEVSLFMEMANSATLAAKRIRADSDANSDRRTSLSLRRGSSVGKRMNAALSSLAPGSSSNHSSSNIATVESNTKVPVNVNEKDKGLVGRNMVENPQVRSTLSVQPTLPSSNGLVQHKSSANIYSHSTIIPSQRKQSKQDQPDKPDAKSMDGNNSGPKGPEINPRISDHQGANNRQSSSTDSERLALPIHLRVITESLPQNRLTGRDMFSTKTSVLRKQRDAIEARLSIYREQHTKQTQHTQQNSLVQPTKNRSMQHRLLSRHKAVALPSRKLTHWDVLLQEMSWMATDFIEERKWKESASRSISSAITSSSETFPNSTRLLGDDSKKRREATSRDTPQSVRKRTQSGTRAENKLESVATGTCTKLKEMATQTYPGHSPEGEEATRKVGRNIALLMATLGTAVMGTIEKQECEHNEDPNFNHQTTGNLSYASRRKDRLRHLTPQKGSSISSGLRVALNGQKSFSSPEISGYVHSFAKMKGQRNGSLFQSDASNSDSSRKMSLSREQKDVVDRVSNMWNQLTKPGIALSGAPLCGKTHTASFMMWQRKKRGPQLLICPTNSMIKWKHAIERLGDIRVLIYSLSGPLSDDISEGAVLPKASDIVICQFELLDQVAGVFESSNNSFQTIVVDSRYPPSFLESLGEPPLGTIVASNGVGSFYASTELLSVPWWDKLLGLSLQSNAAVLLIEHTAGNHLLQDLSNLSPRTKLEITASRAALLIGPRLFLCDGERIQRRVFSWARQHGKLEGRRKSATAQEVLEKATACLTISILSSGWTKEKMGWKLRRCKMDEFQRSNYDACCIGVRGALSSGLAALVARSHDSLRSVSQALMLLRQQCIHAEVTGQSWNDCTHFTERKFSHTRISNPTSKITTENPAQLDSALAFRLIKGSAKLRQMISILRLECGVSLAENLLLGCNLPEQKMESSADKPRKVAILATLPIARRIVSLLLNALGIQHDLLEPTWSECPQESSLSATKASIFSSQHQLMLSCFNSRRRHGSNLHPPTEIVVASPACLAGWNQGLVVENSDVVILVDDDWTGRGEFVLSALMSRIQAHNFHTRKHCDFIRLICEDTIEDKLFSTYASEFSFVESTRWPRDKSGFITVPGTISEALPLYKSSSRSNTREARGFPLFRVIRLRHQLLSKTLLPLGTIPVVLGSTSRIQFLPFAQMDGRNDDSEIYAELALIRVLCHGESVASSYCIFNSKGDQSARYKNKHFFLPPSHPTGVSRPLITKRQNFFVLSYLRNLFVANLQCFESTLAQGPKIMKFSFDKSRHTATVSASHCSAGDKPSTSRSPLFGCSRMSIKSFSGTSVLHYAPRKARDQEKQNTSHSEAKEGFSQEILGITNRSIALQPRPNCYSNLYATSHLGDEACVGYEGFEPLLFSPPLLQGEIQRGLSKHGQLRISEVTKRKGAPIPPVEIPNSKRVRHTEPSSATISRHEDDSKSSLGSKVVNTNSSTEESMELQQQTASQYPNSVPKHQAPPEVPEGRAHGSGNNQSTAAPAHPPYPTNRLGKTVVSRERRVYPVYDSTSETFENILQHSSRESKSFLDSVILFVKNPGMQNMGSVPVARYDSNHTRHSTDMQVPALAPVGVEISTSKGTEDEEKRNKKKGHESIPQPQIALQVPLVQSSNAGQAHTSQASDALKKHGHRHRLYDFFVSRSIGSGLSMFECVPYQAVVCQVEARIARTLEKRELYLGDEEGILVPHQQVEGVSSNTHTQNGRKHAGWEIVGGSVNLTNKREVPSMQALKKPRAVRSRVMGPRGGFLSSSKGMNAPCVPKQQLGMALPMGVKVSQAREEAQHSAWSRSANSLLCDMVEKYDQNWILIAKMMQQILKAEIAKVQYYRTSEILWWKSAENCQRRWESICGIDEFSSTQRDVVGHERRVRSIRHSCCQKAPKETPCHSLLGLRDSPVLVGRTCMMTGLDRSKGGVGNDSDVAIGHQRSINAFHTASQRSPNLVFSSLITSDVQRRLMPIAIIGVGNGPKQNQTAHSHPSHLQSVQESVTSHWSDGRTELWPLQIIDAAEKQYAATRAPSASGKISSHSHVSSSTSPPAGRVHPYPRVPGSATTSAQSGSKSSQASRMSGPNNMGSTSRPSIAPKKSVPHNGLARSSGKSNSRSK
eukprot:CAMPEP_0113619912 /NCGR_PEP_ID=MMETSP0017_2-20120614/10128_1 /TAXON_ID=2856 /ORGANISM="Cylindrotheca closterium" /LENGTH=2329 /DNA_ID=CAMNT_0000529529 /DNA_START=1933 /DNA_END=8922 /DNA_ORIENTATION=+ /assembly_acc=CAM_ASM_000147